MSTCTDFYCNIISLKIVAENYPTNKSMKFGYQLINYQILTLLYYSGTFWKTQPVTKQVQT